MKIGVLVTGDVAVRAAHSAAAHRDVAEVVVIGPASSKSFEVVGDASGCNYLIGSGPTAPRKAERHGVPLLWDGDEALDGVAAYGANPRGLTLAMAARETDPRLVAVAHPSFEAGADHMTTFPAPVGRIAVADTEYGGKRIAIGRPVGGFAAAVVEGESRSVAIVDDGSFMSGIALAASIGVAGLEPMAVWDDALTYLETVASMGLVMAEDV